MADTSAVRGALSILFFGNEGGEPCHVHIDGDMMTAKFWLRPVRFVWGTGFSNRELSRLRSIVIEHEDEIEEAWNDFFGQAS